MRLLSKLARIISRDEAIQNKVDIATSHIEDKLKKEIELYESLLNSTLEEKASARQLRILKQIGSKINSITDNFKEFELGSHDERLKEIADVYRRKVVTILEKADNREKVETLLMNAEVIAEEFDPSILNSITSTVIKNVKKLG